MNKYTITLLVILVCFGKQTYAQQEYHYTIEKTCDVPITEANRDAPYYYNNVHPPEKFFHKTKNEHARIKKYYYPDGSLEKVFYTYKKGKGYNPITYMAKWYHPNGVIAVEDYVNPLKDKLEGYYNTFYENGQLKSTVCRINIAYIYGIKKNYHQNGELASFGLYKGFKGETGQEYGPWSFYHDNGQLAAQGSYINHFSEKKLGAKSEKIGEWTYYDEYGELTKTESY